jgi:hypothetical protein
MPRKNVISPEEGAELQRLYAELPEAQKRVLAAIKTSPPSHELTAEGLAQWIEAERAEGAIIRRIKEILGTIGEPWNA